MSHIQYTEATEKFREYNTWYRSCGNLKGDITPVILIHGGPGFATGDYLFQLQDLLAFERIPSVLYDQLGNGRSTRLRDKIGDKDFWTLDLFKEQLSELIESLKLSKYHLWGHSWGGILAQEFALDKNRSKGLQKLILHSTVASRQDWERQVEAHRNALPPRILAALKRHESASTVESDEYKAAVQEYHTRHICRMEPAPPGLDATLAARTEDPTVGDVMIGSSLFYCSGTLKDWSAKDRLGEILVPTLLINAEYDSTSHAVMRPLFDGIPKSKWITIPDASHVAHLEQPGKVQKQAAEFLLD